MLFYMDSVGLPLAFPILVILACLLLHFLISKNSYQCVFTSTTKRLYFYKSAREYSAVTSRSLMEQRATQIKQKYLMLPGQGRERERQWECKCPVTLPPEVHQRLVDRIDMDEFTHR